VTTQKNKIKSNFLIKTLHLAEKRKKQRHKIILINPIGLFFVKFIYSDTDINPIG